MFDWAAPLVWCPLDTRGARPHVDTNLLDARLIRGFAKKTFYLLKNAYDLRPTR